MLAADLDNILQFLLKEGVQAELQAETNQLTWMIKHKKVEFPTFLRLYDSNDLLQLLVFIPITYEPKATSEVARLLHFINKQLDMPGFGMDEEGSYIYFRMMIHYEDHLSKKEMQRALKTLETVTLGFSPIIIAVAKGATTFQEVANKTAGVRDALEEDKKNQH